MFFRRGSTPPIFKGPAVLRRCCPPSAEGVACCRSPHQPRGAAAVLPFFSARAEEAARCQCLRGWAQAVGHVTPSLDGGPPCFFHGGCGRRVSHCAEEGRGPGTHPIFRLRAERLRTRLHRSLLFPGGGECSPPLFFRGWGGTPPISKALRCGGGAALLLRKEWRAAKVRISFVVQRRCCPFSALELKKWRAANACEAGPRRLAVSLHLGMGGPHGVHGGCGRRGNHCAEEGRGPGTHTIFRLRAEGLPTLFHRNILGERMLPNKVTSARGIHAMPAGVVGVGAYTLHSFSLEILARTCWGRDYPDMTQKLILLGRFGKREEPFSPWPPFSLEPNGPRHLV